MCCLGRISAQLVVQLISVCRVHPNSRTLEIRGMKRYTQLPITLYRIQPRLPVALHDYQSQIANGRTSFDLKLDEKGFVQPVVGTRFTTPNGMSLRPAGDTMIQNLKSFRGTPKIYHLPCGMELPPELVVYHEHTYHYSLQTSEPIRLEAFNKRLTEFLESLSSQTREQFLKQMEDINDQDN